MRKLLSRLRHTLALVWALLMAAVIALWVASEFRVGVLDCQWHAFIRPAGAGEVWRNNSGYWEVTSVAGCLLLDVAHGDNQPYSGPEPHIAVQRNWSHTWDDAAGMVVVGAAWGVEFDPYYNSHGFVPPDPHAWEHEWLLRVRYWLLTLIFALPLMPYGWRAWRARRQRRGAARHGLCAGCGYDLRASPVRCPECGRANDRAGASQHHQGA